MHEVPLTNDGAAHVEGWGWFVLEEGIEGRGEKVMRRERKVLKLNSGDSYLRAGERS